MRGPPPPPPPPPPKPQTGRSRRRGRRSLATSALPARRVACELVIADTAAGSAKKPFLGYYVLQAHEVDPNRGKEFALKAAKLRVTPVR